MKHEHGHRHHHGTRFDDPEHAREFDRRGAASEIRAELAARLVDMLALQGDERVLDLATGTGRIARPVAERLHAGRVVGIDQALAMLRVGREHQDPIPAYSQAAGEAQSLPFRADVFDRAFVSFSLHHFRKPELVVREIHRVLKKGGTFVVLDPVVKEAEDAVDRALEEKINQVFRRTHGEEFRFHTSSSIQDLLTQAGFFIGGSDLPAYSFDQDGMEGIPTGPHWLEAAEELQVEAPELARRLRENYFVWERKGETVHVQGNFSYALVSGEKTRD